MSNISPLAQISTQAKIGENVTISPFSIIEGDVVIGDNTIIHPYVHIKGPVEIGTDNIIYNNVTIGHAPQDLSYKGSSNKIIIGNGNTIREGVTIHAPVTYDDPTINQHTQIGNNCLLMVNSHIAHNTVLHNNVILANSALPSGCCTIYDGVFLSGNVLVHQHVRIGAYTIMSGGSRVGRDVPPFSLISSFYGLISGINSIGLRRAGFSADERKIAKDIFRIFKEENSLNRSIEVIQQTYATQSDSKIVSLMLEFLAGAKRGITSFGEGNEAKDSIF